VLYLLHPLPRLALKRFRGEPAISGFDWHFTPTHSSSDGFSTPTWFGPPRGLTPASPWPWVDHPVSGLRPHTPRPLQTRFPSGSAPKGLSLACDRNSPVHSSIGTPSGLPALGLLVGTRFQVLFHSPPGVLFTFPSRYWCAIGRQASLALEGGPPGFPRDSSCPAVLGITGRSPPPFAYGALTLCRRPFQACSARRRVSYSVEGLPPLLPAPSTPHAQRRQAFPRMRFGLFPFRSPLLRESQLISSPPPTKMFQFGGCPPAGYRFTSR
jgi:hypothetical protein